MQWISPRFPEPGYLHFSIRQYPKQFDLEFLQRRKNLFNVVFMRCVLGKGDSYQNAPFTAPNRGGLKKNMRDVVYNLATAKKRLPVASALAL